MQILDELNSFTLINENREVEVSLEDGTEALKGSFGDYEDLICLDETGSWNFIINLNTKFGCIDPSDL